MATNEQQETQMERPIADTQQMLIAVSAENNTTSTTESGTTPIDLPDKSATTPINQTTEESAGTSINLSAQENDPLTSLRELTIRTQDTARDLTRRARDVALYRITHYRNQHLTHYQFIFELDENNENYTLKTNPSPDEIELNSILWLRNVRSRLNPLSINLELEQIAVDGVVERIEAPHIFVTPDFEQEWNAFYLQIIPRNPATGREWGLTQQQLHEQFPIGKKSGVLAKIVGIVEPHRFFKTYTIVYKRYEGYPNLTRNRHYHGDIQCIQWATRRV